MSDILNFNRKVPSVFDVFNQMQGGMVNNAEKLGHMQYFRDRGQADLQKAQADEMRAQQTQMQSDPFAQIERLKSVYDSTEPGSPQHQYADMMLGYAVQNPGAFGGMGGSHKGAGGGLGMGGGSAGGIGGQAPGFEMNPLSNFRNRGTQYEETLPDGTKVIKSSPTTPVMTQNQMRETAGYEAAALMPAVEKGIAPYNQTGKGVDIALDSYRARQGDKAARQRLVDYVASYGVMRAVALNRMRQEGQTTTGEESVTSMMKHLFPSAPSATWLNTIPKDINNEALKKQGQLIDNASKSVQMQVAKNFPLDVGNEDMGWMQQQAAPTTWSQIVAARNAPPVQPQKTAAPKKSSDSKEMVKMVSPSGKVALVPKNKVKAALAAGGKYG